MDSNTVTSPSGIMISHRRIRSDSATHPHSKLSSFTSAPLTPTIEEGRTSGGRTASGTQGSPGGAGGFFSSVFSAAQNAANTLSNTIANNQTRSRSSTQDSEMDENNGVDEPTAVVPQVEPGQMNQQRQLAVETLGSGDLSLSHLGISSDTLASHPDGVSAAQRDEAAARAEHISAARAVSAAYSEKPHDDGTAASIGGDTAVSVRPGSTYESSMAEEKTPPNGSVFEGNHGPRRSGSVRSRVGGVVRRHRNNSNATGTTIGAAIGAGHAALANPTANSSVPKLTGFAVASKKRNRDFHQLFRSVPEDDYLIEDYSCALQRDIILAGRIYVSEGHICFSSNILGWVTTLIISFDEVVSIEKESTAVVFPNAIAIQTLHARHTFRSLLSREATYELMVGIWKINHPSLKSSLNGVRLVEGGTGDKTEKVEPSGSEGGSDDSDDDDGIYDEDEDDEGDGSFIEAGDGSIAGSEAGDSIIKSESRKTSAVGVAAGMAAGSVPTAPPAKAGEKASAAATTAAVDFPGPTSHAPTECGDADTHYDIVIGDEVIAAPLGKVYSMMFGPASGGFLSRWLLDEQRVTELQMEDDKKGLSDEVRSRSYSYIKPLSGPIGPKQTKCLINETIEAFDLEKAITITSSTQTPDVPSGNVFSTKTKYCLTWAPGNSTRVQMNCMIEWTGKSWLKNPIEKGAKDGQLAYATDLIKALKLGISSRPRAGTSASKSKLRTKRGKNSLSTSKPSTASSSASPQKKEDSWGLLEPLHGPLGPVVDILHPLVSANTVIAFLLFLLLISWFRGSRARAPTGSADAGVGFAGSSTPERVAAYEEIWRREESELWDWMEERVGMRGGCGLGGRILVTRLISVGRGSRARG
ncbi:MAG: hypothetical protein FRX48_04870 [Lasallia pustulata]|uniref:VASt domain-containing protein n=1 Tax=Lasallia pustulata TaxID=136370 RepID=A0A5M8PQ07_9LECA|nr:MAG: hypothetical protein FRX48_04870 [Lasallia pustulata]